MQRSKGVQQAPFRVLLYGVPGIGKSTLASLADGASFVDAEHGTKRLNVDRINVESYGEVCEATKELIADPNVKTIIPDSVTAINKMIERDVCKKYNEQSIGERNDLYGADYTDVATHWARFCELMEEANRAGKNVILIAHQVVKTIKNPTLDSYDKLVIDISKKAMEPVVASMDAVFYYCFEQLRNDKKKRLEATGRRMIITRGFDDQYLAKSRYKVEDRVYMPSSGEEFVGAARSFWGGLV